MDERIIDIVPGSKEYINKIAGEYFCAASESGSSGRAKALLNRLAYEMIYNRQNGFCREATTLAWRQLSKYSWYESGNEPAELLNICFMDTVKSYSYERSDNFAQWFLDNISFAAGKMFESYFHKTNKAEREADKESGEEGASRRADLVRVPISDGNRDSGDNTRGYDMSRLEAGTDVSRETESSAEAAAYLVRLCAGITKLFRSGKFASRYRYFRCFTTDLVVNVCRSEKLHRQIEMNENELMSVMDCGFLDFVYTKPCRTLNEIDLTPLKTGRAAGISDSDEELPVPFELKVFSAYLKVSESSVSQIREKYKLLERSCLDT
ncbi:MAG: hypothetical protein IJ874_07090 [Ruminococcus sp.]|nr:hypothetical protein [Ruminococcus sp.]